MKIGIVCYPTFGGSGVVATELGIALANRGHEIHFITYKQPVRLALLNQHIHFHEVHVPEYPLFHYQPYELALSSKLVDTVLAHDIELLHVHYAIPHAYAGYMAQQMLREHGKNIPMVTTLHGTDITLVGQHPFYKPAVQFSINQSNVVTSVSADLKKKTNELFQLDKEISVVPNFIDASKYVFPPTDCQRTLIAKDSERVITHISNFRPVKCIPDVIEVFDRIQREIPAKLMMVGDGPERHATEALARTLGIEEHVRFLGKQEQIEDILAVTDVFLLPSEYESFGLAALEAMAARAVVISSDAGGLHEINIQGETGYMAPVGDVAAMSGYAISLLSDENKLMQMKQAAYEQACLFDISKIIPEYEKLYSRFCRM